MRDESAAAEIVVELSLDGHGVLEQRTTLRNLAPERCTDEELAALSRFADAYRSARELLATGASVHVDLDDAAVMLHGVVSPNRERALFAWVQLGTSVAQQQGRVPIPGLHPAIDYVVHVREDLGVADRGMTTGPPWFDVALTDGIHLPGAVLASAGLPFPPLRPGSAVLIELVAVEGLAH